MSMSSSRPGLTQEPYSSGAPPVNKLALAFARQQRLRGLPVHSSAARVPGNPPTEPNIALRFGFFLLLLFPFFLMSLSPLPRPSPPRTPLREVDVRALPFNDTEPLYFPPRRLREDQNASPLLGPLPNPAGVESLSSAWRRRLDRGK